jgi:hypothetical protein
MLLSSRDAWKPYQLGLTVEFGQPDDNFQRCPEILFKNHPFDGADAIQNQIGVKIHLTLISPACPAPSPEKAPAAPSCEICLLIPKFTEQHRAKRKGTGLRRSP